MSRLLPSLGDLDRPIHTQERQTSRTYRLDTERGRIVGMIDSQDAARQAVWKILRTEQDAYGIYGESGYGIALVDLIGQERIIVTSELQRRIMERLRADDRVTDVHSFSFVGGLDDLRVSFIVETIFGAVTEERRLNMA